MAPDIRGDVLSPYLSARSGTPPVLASSLVEFNDRVDGMFAVNLPSRASNAADGIVDIGVAPDNLEILSAYFVPISSQAGSATHFAIARLINTSSDGAGTEVIASKSLSAAGAGVAAHVFSAGSMALSSVSMTQGHGIAASYASQGNGIAIVPHTFVAHYRLR